VALLTINEREDISGVTLCALKTVPLIMPCKYAQASSRNFSSIK